MITVLLLIAGVYGASIPTRTDIFPSSPCLSKCFEQDSAVVAANDLKNFRKIVVDIDNFCHLHSTILTCGSKCPEEDNVLLSQVTGAASYICGEKIEEFRSAKECLQKSDDDFIYDCMRNCGLESQDTTALRFDSAPSSPMNPASLPDTLAPVCRNHLCTMQCSVRTLNEKCNAVGTLFKDIARAQMLRGHDRLVSEQANEANPTVRTAAVDYVNRLPEECAFLRDVKKFDTLTQPIGDDVTAPVRIEGETEVPQVTSTPEEHTAATVVISDTAELEKENPVGSDMEGGEEVRLESGEVVTEETVNKKEEEAGSPFLAKNRDDPSAHVFQPEDDFVPFGKPENATDADSVTENPAVAQPEEDVKIADQGHVDVTPVEKSEETTGMGESAGEQAEEKNEGGSGDSDMVKDAEEVVTKVEAPVQETTDFQKDLPAVTTESSEEDRLTISVGATDEFCHRGADGECLPAAEPASAEEPVEEPKMDAITESPLMTETIVAGETEGEVVVEHVATTGTVEEATVQPHIEVDESEMEKLEEAMKHEMEGTTEAVLVVQDGQEEEVANNEVHQPEMAQVVSSASLPAALLSLILAILAL